ncbi:glycosyl transferase family 2 [Paucibacter sp. KBW04]|uniref:glycosyltransferase family 2 protein n=1 Tax=Paucibacter sp. KBW04 TaxID=2153361 RepID=UPI000F57F9F1|nr:glycosyltransferase [Paucibacter sp. KBW04]RQO63562.1 glycosyl transferase family 2 [Paucibacter sp. KBW04]
MTSMPAQAAPWLSLILPVYKVEAYLQACADSILQQADEGVELIFVDDASPDASSALIEALQARHPQQIRLIRHAQNQGLSAARNTGLAAAQGSYVWCVDPDDLMEPGVLPRLKALIEGPATQGLDLLLCDFRSFDDGQTQSKPKYAHVSTFAGPSNSLQTDTEALLTGMFAQGQFHAWTKIVRRAAWPQDLRFPVGKAFEDLAVYPRLALTAQRWMHVNEVWMAYRQRPGSILSSLNASKLEDWMSALVGLPKALRAPGLSFSPQGLLLIAHFCARTFVRVCKRRTKLRDADAGKALKRFARQFAASSPIAPQELLRSYLKTGRLLRFLQLRYWLNRATG